MSSTYGNITTLTSLRRKHIIVSHMMGKSHLIIEKRDTSISLIKSNLPELLSS